MKTHMKELAAFTFTSFLATSLIVACGQPQKGATVSKGSEVHSDSGTQQKGVPGSSQNPQAKPRYDVTVTDSKPMIDLIKSVAGDVVNSILNNPKASGKLDETISMDLQLKNLQESQDSSPGNGSILVLQTVLNNSVDKPFPFTLQSNPNTSVVILSGSKLTATFQFMDAKGKTVMLTAVLDGTLSSDDSSSDAKTFSGNISLMDSDNTKNQIGTFSVPLKEVMLADDLAKLNSQDKSQSTDQNKDSSSDTKNKSASDSDKAKKSDDSQNQTNTTSDQQKSSDASSSSTNTDPSSR